MKKTCIIISGPTAIGKTSFAIEVARHFSTEIVSADSRQCYREMNIGVARPSDEELAAVPHYFIASHSIKDTVNAAVFEQYALEQVNHIFQKKDFAVMVGGTGLYIRAFCEGLDEVPVINPLIRDKVRQQYELSGLDWLQSTLKEKDPLFFEKGEYKNPHRLLRALEVVLSTGQSILTYQRQKPVQRNFNIIQIGLTMPRLELNERINQRVDRMMEEGLLKEVENLLSFQHLNALQTVGYSELFDYLKEKHSLDLAVELIKQHTRQYAKRQVTWFNKVDGMTSFHPGTANPGEIEKLIDISQ